MVRRRCSSDSDSWVTPEQKKVVWSTTCTDTPETVSKTTGSVDRNTLHHTTGPLSFQINLSVTSLADKDSPHQRPSNLIGILEITIRLDPKLSEELFTHYFFTPNNEVHLYRTIDYRDLGIPQWREVLSNKNLNNLYVWIFNELLQEIKRRFNLEYRKLKLNKYLISLNPYTLEKYLESD